MLDNKIYLLKFLGVALCFLFSDDVLGVDLNSFDFRLDSQKAALTVEKPKQLSKTSTQASLGNIAAILTQIESEFGLPRGLLSAIAKIESNLSPNAINVGGRAHYFSKAEEAADFVNECLGQGKKNISVGCLQLLYVAHQKAFGNSALNMLNLEKNARYAAKYLQTLFKRYGTWEMAVKRYHSPNPSNGERYLRKIEMAGFES